MTAGSVATAGNSSKALNLSLICTAARFCQARNGMRWEMHKQLLMSVVLIKGQGEMSVCHFKHKNRNTAGFLWT